MTDNLKLARIVAENQAGAAWATMSHRDRLYAIQDALEMIRNVVGQAEDHGVNGGYR